MSLGPYLKLHFRALLKTPLRGTQCGHKKTQKDTFGAQKGRKKAQIHFVFFYVLLVSRRKHMGGGPGVENGICVFLRPRCVPKMSFFF